VKWLLAVAAVALVAPGATRAPVPVRHTVQMTGMAFVPSVLDAHPGDTVRWINRDIVPHTATLDGPGRWDSGELARGDSAEWVVGKPGVVEYRCRLHPTMTGRIRTK
jgi:plastocyanin